MRAPLTVGKLVETLAAGELDADAEVRLVFHGRSRASFNLPALEARAGIHNDLVVVCFEEHATGRELEVPDA